MESKTYNKLVTVSKKKLDIEREHTSDHFSVKSEGEKGNTLDRVIKRHKEPKAK